jgi:ATP-dependent DNA helicase RecG
MELLARSISELKGVGTAVAEKLSLLGIINIQDLLLHIPRKYIDKTRVVPLVNLISGEYMVTEGTISKVQVTFVKGKRQLHVILQHNHASLELVFFYFNKAMQDKFVIGQKVRCFGEIRLHKHSYQITHPEFIVCELDAIIPVETTLTPIYPLAKGISQKLLVNLVKQALLLLKPIANLLEIFPPAVLEKYNMLDFFTALEILHFPTPDQRLEVFEAREHPAQRRIILEELLAHNLALRHKKLIMQSKKAPIINNDQKLLSQFLISLPFKLTNAQINAVNIIQEDLSLDRPMLRLVQGDVGSGKTIVAICAAMMGIESKFQVALMAPTEILAEQHYQVFSNFLNKLGIKVVFLCSKLKSAIKKQTLEMISSGQADIAIGTHALFQEQVQFKNLGLMIVDEQHRFGVDQRLALQNKGVIGNMSIHQLTMTATPIPRSLAMAMYADLDYTIIDEMPIGRIPIKTLMVSQQRKHEVLQMISKLCAQKSQVYWVCTLIEENLTIEAQDVEQAFLDLQMHLPHLKIGLVHGKMNGEQKEQQMHKFKNAELDVLVATTVIEVGVDVPNASLMVIENPERLGLSQLHQLRGRVGRGSLESFCILLYGAKISANSFHKLQIIKNTLDGYVIATEDLKLRGSGELLGKRQTGLPSYKIADLLRDQQTLPAVQELAKILLMEHPRLVTILINKWVRTKLEYAQV